LLLRCLRPTMAQIHSVDISRIILVLETFLLDGVIQSELSVIETIDQIVQQNRFFLGLFSTTVCCQHFKLYQLLVRNLEEVRYIYHQKTPPGLLSSRCLGQNSLQVLCRCFARYGFVSREPGWFFDCYLLLIVVECFTLQMKCHRLFLYCIFLDPEAFP